MSIGARTAAARVVVYAVVGGFVGAVPALVAGETVLGPRWDGGLQYLGRGLIVLLLGVLLGTLGAVLGVLLARRQLKPQGVAFDDPPPILSLPAMGVLGGFLGAIITGGLWGAVIAGVLLIGVAVLAAQ